MAVTAIKYMRNDTRKPAYVYNRESGRSWEINPNQSESTDEWVPWCSDPAEFGRHHIEIKFYLNNGNAAYSWYIWQSTDSDGDKVRVSNDGKYPGRGSGEGPAQGAPGYSGVGGNRILRVHEGAFLLEKSG